MTMLRAFIALDISQEIRARIGQVAVSLTCGMDAQAVRWVPVGNIHLTLKFLGDVSPLNLELLKQVILQEAASQAPFDLMVCDLGCFPNSRRPRVIWAGLAAPPALEKLQRSMDQSTARLGYASETRPFSPHLTIGRVNPSASPEALSAIRSVLEKNRSQQFGTVRVTDVVLYQSDLRPSGAQYTPLCYARLGVNP